MREIKFRGKRVGNIWVYGDLVHIDKGYIIITSTNLTIDNSLSEDNALVYSEKEFSVVIPETLGQFTGLTDKNGKEIYEGDVIRIHEGRNDFKITLIIWNDEYLCYDPTNDELRHILRSRYSEYYEIIGNIHDNPEILNKE